MFLFKYEIIISIFKYANKIKELLVKKTKEKQSIIIINSIWFDWLIDWLNDWLKPHVHKESIYSN